MEIRMRDAADMPELGEDRAADAMHRVGDVLPARDLLGRVDAGRADIADALRADLRALGDHQAGGGALHVVGGGQRVRDIAFKRAAARHRRQHEPVVQRDGAQAVRREQGGLRRGRDGEVAARTEDWTLMG